MTNNPTPDLTELELREQLYGAMDGNLRMSLRRKLLDGYREAILASVQTEPAAVSSPPATDRAALRDRIADTVTPFLANFSDEETAKVNAGEVADAVLAVLPPPADRAAVYRWAADDLDAAFGDPMVTHIGKLGASHLRRRAREIEAGSGQTGEGQPETPLEKRLRFSERRNDELRAECKRRGKIKLEQAETIARLERQLDEVRTQLGAEILRAGQAEAELRHVADEAQPAAVAPEVVLDLSEAPIRCPLCPHPVTLHTPNGARAHFTAVHPEQRVTGRGSGPWPLLVTDGDEAQQQPDTETLAAALDGLHTLIATSSRDWGTYRVDAWLWAVLVGWDCEEAHEHDELCDQGAAMAEVQRMHGWDDDTVAKARRYRAAVRALTAPAVVSQPGKET